MNENNQELISVVMPSLNQANYIREAIASVLQQDVTRVELIVADGGSADGTVAILEEISDRDRRLKWFSEPDRGPADALNKAFIHCRGTILGWLNSDDLYSDGALSSVLLAFHQNRDWVMLYGRGEHIDGKGNPIGEYPSSPPDSNAMESFRHGCFICQPTVFLKRSTHRLTGELNVNLATAFDFDYWLRIFRLFPGRIGHIDTLLARSRLHDACITLTQRRKVTIESMQSILKHIGDPPAHWLISYANERIASEPSIGISSLREELKEMVDELGAGLSNESYNSLLRAIDRMSPGRQSERT